MKATLPLSPFARSMQRPTSYYILIVLLAVASFILGYLVHSIMATRNVFYPLFSEAYDIYSQNAYADIPDHKSLEYGMIRGMLAAGEDPYTQFFDPALNELQTNRLEGKFGGIGIRIEYDTEKRVRLYPLPNSPAQKAGLQDGDILLSVDDLRLQAETSLDTIQATIRGPVNSHVHLTIQRGNQAPTIEYSILRIEVSAPSVTYNLSTYNPVVGVIQVSIIAASTAEEIQQAVKDLRAQGAVSFVIDLRNNGGGLVEGGFDLASLFLQKDLIIIEEQFRGQQKKTLITKHDGPLIDVPIIILINHNTASAAEIFSASIQHYHRAQIIGGQSLGKDSVQLVFDLADKSSIHVTAGKWWLPGRQDLLGGVGITPDIRLSEVEANAPAALQKAVELVAP